jgi:hypothetical protein
MNSLESGRYKTCGYSYLRYNQDEEDGEVTYKVTCRYSKEPFFCGDASCPLDDDREPDEDDEAQRYHGEDKGYD